MAPHSRSRQTNEMKPISIGGVERSGADWTAKKATEGLILNTRMNPRFLPFFFTACTVYYLEA